MAYFVFALLAGLPALAAAAAYRGWYVPDVVSAEQFSRIAGCIWVAWQDAPGGESGCRGARVRCGERDASRLERGYGVAVWGCGSPDVTWMFSRGLRTGGRDVAVRASFL